MKRNILSNKSKYIEGVQDIIRVKYIYNDELNIDNDELNIYNDIINGNGYIRLN